MTQDWELYQEQVLRAREEMHNKLARHRAEMAEFVGGGLIIPGEVEDGDLEWAGFEPPGTEIAVIEGASTEIAVTGDPVAEAKFDDKVHKVLSEVIEDTRDDPGHARSVQYRHVAERKLQRAVEKLEEAT